MLSTLRKGTACVFTTSVRAHLHDVPSRLKSEMLARRVRAEACLPTSAAVSKINAVLAQRVCPRYRREYSFKMFPGCVSRPGLAAVSH